MSQEKVDYNKELKKNRKQEVKKRKYAKAARITIAVCITAVLLGWIGFSVYKKEEVKKAENPVYHEVDTSGLTSYLYSLQQ